MGFLSQLFGGAPSAFPKPKTPDPLRGWTNIGLYEVHGINPKTGRSNKKSCQALSDEAARAWALSVGLVDPITVSETPRLRPSSAQIKRLKKEGYRGDVGLLTNVDASAIISYAEDEDLRRITQAEWDKACAAGYEISALSGPSLYRAIMETGDWRAHIDE